MLDTGFPRVPGDLGNPVTWGFPVRYRVVKGASAVDAVRGDPLALAPAFVAAGRDLVDQGCAALATSCGFLSLIQNDLASALGVPFVASSLSQVAMVRSLMPRSQSVGILTISAQNLTAAHLRAANVPVDTPILGLDGSHFAQAILSDSPRLDTAQCEAEMVQAASDLIAGRPDLGAIVLECTNMVPYAQAIARATGRPVFSIKTLIDWLYHSIAPPVF